MVSLFINKVYYEMSNGGNSISTDFSKVWGITIRNSIVLNFKKPLNFFTYFLNVFIDYTKNLALRLLQIINYIKFSFKKSYKNSFFHFFYFWLFETGVFKFEFCIADRQISNFCKFFRKHNSWMSLIGEMFTAVWSITVLEP